MYNAKIYLYPKWPQLAHGMEYRKHFEQRNLNNPPSLHIGTHSQELKAG